MHTPSSHPHLQVRSAAVELGQVIAGTRYRALELVGLGGMGAVYEVQHVELGKPFVMKLLYPALSGRGDFVARLKREQRALARLEHPNIVSVTDAGTTGHGVPFFVMERLRGRTLSVELRRRAPLDVTEAIGIVAEVLDGLSAAHAIGIVHRDVKPANVFVTHSGSVKLLDFGIAKDLGQLENQTGHSVVLATPRYMSPEQAGRRAVDHRSDLYSAGLLLWHALSGKAPYQGLHAAADLVRAHSTQRLERLSELRPGIHPLLDDVTWGLLAKDPEQRPHSAALVAELLRGVAREYGGAGGSGSTVLARYDAPTAAAAPLATVSADTRRATPLALAEACPGDTSALPTLIFEASDKLSPVRSRRRIAVAGGLVLVLGLVVGVMGPRARALETEGLKLGAAARSAAHTLRWRGRDLLPVEPAPAARAPLAEAAPFRPARKVGKPRPARPRAPARPSGCADRSTDRGFLGVHKLPASGL